MKKSQLREIIKEEIKKYLAEGRLSGLAENKLSGNSTLDNYIEKYIGPKDEIFGMGLETDFVIPKVGESSEVPPTSSPDVKRIKDILIQNNIPFTTEEGKEGGYEYDIIKVEKKFLINK